MNNTGHSIFLMGGITRKTRSQDVAGIYISDILGPRTVENLLPVPLSSKNIRR